MDNILQYFSQYSIEDGFFMPILLLVSFFAGILSSLSPCSLGILPLILAYIGGYSKENNRKLLVQMISFSFGLSLVLSIIGVVCALTGRVFAGFAPPVLMLLFASILFIMGLNLIGVLEIQFPAIVKKMPQNKSGGLFLFPFLVGVFFALAASPCSSPILASIMAVAAISNSILYSIALLFSFAAGQCVIIIIFALFTASLKHLNSLAKFSSVLIKASGIILIFAGLYIYYSVFSGI